MSPLWEIRFTKQAKKDVERLPPSSKPSSEKSSSKLSHTIPTKVRSCSATWREVFHIGSPIRIASFTALIRNAALCTSNVQGRTTASEAGLPTSAPRPTRSHVQRASAGLHRAGRLCLRRPVAEISGPECEVGRISEKAASEG